MFENIYKCQECGYELHTNTHYSERECTCGGKMKWKKPPTVSSSSLATGYVPLQNGKNKVFLTITCPYEVYPAEWEELHTLIATVLKEHDGGKFSNVDVNWIGT